MKLFRYKTISGFVILSFLFSSSPVSAGSLTEPSTSTTQNTKTMAPTTSAPTTTATASQTNALAPAITTRSTTLISVQSLATPEQKQVVIDNINNAIAKFMALPIYTTALAQINALKASKDSRIAEAKAKASDLIAAVKPAAEAVANDLSSEPGMGNKTTANSALAGVQTILANANGTNPPGYITQAGLDAAKNTDNLVSAYTKDIKNVETTYLTPLKALLAKFTDSMTPTTLSSVTSQLNSAMARSPKLPTRLPASIDTNKSKTSKLNSGLSKLPAIHDDWLAAEKARDSFIRILGISPGSDAAKNITTVRVAKATWPDSCVGWNSPDRMCAQVITEGRKVVLKLQNNFQLEFHNGIPDPAKDVILMAMKDVLAKGADLKTLKVTSSQAVSGKTLPVYPSALRKDGTPQYMDAVKIDPSGKVIDNLRWEFTNSINWDLNSGVTASGDAFTKTRNTDPATRVTKITTTYASGAIDYSTELQFSNGTIGIASNLNSRFERNPDSSYSSRLDLGNGTFGFVNALNADFTTGPNSYYSTLKNLGNGAFGIGSNLNADFTSNPGISHYSIQKNMGKGKTGIAWDVNADFSDKPGISAYTIQQDLRNGKVGLVLDLGPGFVTTPKTNYFTQRVNPLTNAVEIGENLTSTFSNRSGISKYSTQKQKSVYDPNYGYGTEVATGLDSNFRNVPGKSEYSCQYFMGEGMIRIASGLTPTFGDNPGKSKYTTQVDLGNGTHSVVLNLDKTFNRTSATIDSIKTDKEMGAARILVQKGVSREASPPGGTPVTLITVKDMLKDGRIVQSWEIGAGKDGKAFTSDDVVTKPENQAGLYKITFSTPSGKLQYLVNPNTQTVMML